MKLRILHILIAILFTIQAGASYAGSPCYCMDAPSATADMPCHNVTDKPTSSPCCDQQCTCGDISLVQALPLPVIIQPLTAITLAQPPARLYNGYIFSFRDKLTRPPQFA